MIDIVNFSGEMFELGYEKIYNLSNFNIAYGSKDNRRIIANRKVDILVSPEREMASRSLTAINSGLNEAICKIASKNDIAIGISFHDILKSNNKPAAIARVMQNVRLCRKYKVRMMMASFASNKYEMRHAKDMLNFCLVLGMNDGEAKEALSFKKKEEKIRFV